MQKKLLYNLKRSNWKLWGFFLLIFIIGTPLLILTDFPQRDVVHRYVPMAEAFARGDWMYAFHPRVQMLHPAFSGFFSWLFSVNGFIGTQISGLFFHAIGIFPLFYLLKEVFGKQIAYWGIFAYVFSSRLLQLSVTGVREPHKQFVILLLTLAVILVYKYRQSLKGYTVAGIACGLTVCIKNDTILFAAIMFAVCAVLDVYKNKVPWRSALAGVFAIIFAIPELFINYKLTGYVLPGSYFLELFTENFHQEPTLANTSKIVFIAFAAVFLIFLPLLGWILRRKYGKQICTVILLAGVGFVCFEVFKTDFRCSDEDIEITIKNTFYGVLPLLFFLMLPGFFYRIFRKKFTSAEWLLLGTFLLQGTLIYLQYINSNKELYISQRYLLPGTPLYFGWLGFTAMLIWRLLGKLKMNRKQQMATGTALVIAFILGSYGEALYVSSYTHGKGKHVLIKKQTHEIAEIIKNDYKGKRYWNPEFDIFNYKSNYYPAIWFPPRKKYSAAAYYSGGSYTQNIKEAEYVVIEANRKLSGSHYEKIGKEVWDKRGKIQVWKRKPFKKQTKPKQQKAKKKPEKRRKS